MRVFKALLVLACLGALVGAGAVVADEIGWRTEITLNETTEVPGAVLEPGKYMIQVLDTKVTRKVVQFQNAEGTKVFATVLAIPYYRVNPTDESRFVYFQRAEGRPQALKSWFYPAHNFGVEFVYPKAEAIQIAQVSKENVFAAEPPKPEAKVVAITPEQKEVPVKEPEMLVAENIKMPRTGSNLPLLALAGLASLAAAGTLRILAGRR
jgi:hypothetical protein